MQCRHLGYQRFPIMQGPRRMHWKTYSNVDCVKDSLTVNAANCMVKHGVYRMLEITIHVLFPAPLIGPKTLTSDHKLYNLI